MLLMCAALSASALDALLDESLVRDLAAGALGVTLAKLPHASKSIPELVVLTICLKSTAVLCAALGDKAGLVETFSASVFMPMLLAAAAVYMVFARRSGALALKHSWAGESATFVHT
eukprot:6212935-Pleurochrysis_carterae.AAC.5